MRLAWSVVVFACGVLWLSGAPASAQEYSNPPKTGAEARGDDADAALRGLLRSPRVSVDPGVAQLEALWVELSARPLAKTAGKPGLTRARAELVRLRELIGQRADAQVIARTKQLVWAALSSSDRQMARAELAVALRDALTRREQVEAQLRAAKHARAAQQTEADEARVLQGGNAEPAK